MGPGSSVLRCSALAVGLRQWLREEPRELSAAQLRIYSGRQLRSVSISLLSEGQLMTGKALDKYENISVKINPQSTRTDIIASCTYSDYGDSFSEIDTVTVLYEVQPRFLDLSCGCTVSYNITQVTSTHHLFGNVVLNNAYVDSETGLNLTIEY